MKDINVSEWVTYVPEWMGNREEEDPMTVEAKPVFMKESEQYAGMIVTTQRPGFRNQTTDNTVKVGKKQFLNCVRNIKGLRFNGADITTAKQVWEDTPFSDLINELTSAINSISVLMEGDAKNFASQSDGSKKAAGTAKSA